VFLAIESVSYDPSGRRRHRNLPTLALAVVVAIAVGNTVVAPLRANEVWQSLRVHCDVRGAAVIADAGVAQSVGVAVVLLCGHGGDAGLLEADKRALGLVLLAPVVCLMVRCASTQGEVMLLTPSGLVDSVWVDGVLFLSSTEAGHGGNAEGESVTHLDGRDDGCGCGCGC
jgi:hypothetical protein